MRSGCSAKQTGGGSLSWPNCSERLSGRSRNEGEVLRYRREVLRPTREVPGKMGLAAYRRQNRFEGKSEALSEVVWSTGVRAISLVPVCRSRARRGGRIGRAPFGLLLPSIPHARAAGAPTGRSLFSFQVSACK